MSVGKFLPGRTRTGGRARGTRNMISAAFLKDLASEWEASGPAALKIMAKQEPGNFVKVVAALLPKEFSIEDNRLNELSDEELDVLIEQLRGKLRSAIITNVGSGETPTLN